ncbi:MAG: signal peptide peptidase SppA [Dehalococcoidia bacterium]
MKSWELAILVPATVIIAQVSYRLYNTISESTKYLEGVYFGLKEMRQGAMASSIGIPQSFALPLQPRIAVVELFGIIGGGAKMASYINVFDSLRLDKKVKAVVLDIDSPGGSATSSSYLYHSLSKLNAEKPVIAFIRGTGASGAYLVSCAATKVVALPNAIVGSIGVISVRPVLQELLQRMGINVSVTKSGPLKDMGAFYRESTDEEKQKEQDLIKEFYDDFVASVAQARNIDVQTMQKYATGEIFTARKAKELGLIDELGDMNKALDLASELGQVPRRVTYVRPKKPFLQRLVSRFTASVTEELMGEIESLLLPHIQYRYP